MNNNHLIRPFKIRLEASTICQLKCPSCPTATGETADHLGAGCLRFEDFKRFIDENPWIASIELSNWGEVFLNKELPRMLEYAHKQRIALHAINGANLNHVSEEALESLVKYQFQVLTCSLDGACQEIYEKYRVNGDFNSVIENIKLINKYKKQYDSRKPELIWQFVAFGHNEHEINKARAMARELGMGFSLKLSWEDMYVGDFSPVQDTELIKRETGLDVANRDEYSQKYNKEYKSECCLEMWSEPQINYDGRLLGCPVNYWGDFGNVFADGFLESLNSEKMNYARAMLLGKVESREGIPCSSCKIYQKMLENGTWITTEDLKPKLKKARFVRVLQDRFAGPKLTKRLLMMYRQHK